jgi:uncharacterized Zn-finger protein
VPIKKAKLPLSKTHPKLAKEADGWDPKTITSGSQKKLKWKCSKNHIWSAVVGNRSTNNTGCPFCSGKKVLKGFNDLKTTHPKLAKEAIGWDPTKFSKGSQKKLKWKCSKNHIWETSINSRTNRLSGCSVCDGKMVLIGYNHLLSQFPEIAKQAYGWDPKGISAHSSKNMEWQCNRKHRWFADVSNRTSSRGAGCPYCSNRYVLTGFNDLQTTDPEVAKQAYKWNPTTVTRASDKYRNWICGKKHIYSARIANRVKNGSGCPYCSGNKIMIGFNDLLTTHPNLAKESLGWNPVRYSFGSNTVVKWKCSLDHVWKASIASRAAGMQTNCPSCALYGFDPNEKGYLYFLTHSNWQMLQIGITNLPEDRINRHKRNGWELEEIRGPMDGHLARQWETAILRMLKARGADLSNNKIVGKFEGYSEAWSISTFPVKSIKELMRLTEEFEEKI